MLKPLVAILLSCALYSCAKSHGPVVSYSLPSRELYKDDGSNTGLESDSNYYRVTRISHHGNDYLVTVRNKSNTFTFLTSDPSDKEKFSSYPDIHLGKIYKLSLGSVTSPHFNGQKAFTHDLSQSFTLADGYTFVVPNDTIPELFFCPNLQGLRYVYADTVANDNINFTPARTIDLYP